MTCTRKKDVEGLSCGFEAGKKIQRINSNRETEIPYRSENDGSRLLPPADTIA